MKESLLLMFVAYVYNDKTVKDDTFTGHLTALHSFLIESGIPFSRFDMPVLKREHTGYAFLRGNKAKSGLYRPCLLINENETKATIVFIRCGKEKKVSSHTVQTLSRCRVNLVHFVFP